MTIAIRDNLAASDGLARAGQIGDTRTAKSRRLLHAGRHPAAVKAMSPDELWDMGYRLMLANAYHLAVRPGQELVGEMGGIARFMGFPGAVLTDSGGYQAMSLAKINSIDEKASGSGRISMARALMLTPESAVQMQEALGSDIMMALDECTPFPADARARPQLARNDRPLGRAMSARAPERDPGAVRDRAREHLCRSARGSAPRRSPRCQFDGYATGGCRWASQRPRCARWRRCRRRICRRTSRIT